MIKFNLVNRQKLTQKDMREMTTRERTLIRLQDILDKVVPLAIVGLMGWILLTSLTIQREITTINIKLVEVETHLAEHRSEFKQDREDNSRIHHTALVTDNKCTGCHASPPNKKVKD